MNEIEILEKVLEQMKGVEGEQVTIEDAKAAYDFVKDQIDFDLCKVIQEALDGNPAKVKELQDNMYKVAKISLCVASGIMMATVAVLTAPAILAAIPVLGGGAAAGGAAIAGTTVAPLAIGTTAATTTAVATTGATALAATEGLTVVAGGLSAGTAATVAAAGAVTGVGVVAGGTAAGEAGGKALAKAIAGGGTAVIAAEGVGKSLSKKNVVAALSSTLLIADICEAVEEVARYDIAINQGNTKLLEANHKINPVYEEALWKVEDYDTQMFFVGTEITKYQSSLEKIDEQVSKCTPGGMCAKPFSEATVVYCNIVTKENNMFMYVIMLNHAWFHPAGEAEANKEFLKTHTVELLSKHGITRDNIAFMSLSSGTTKIISEEFLRGKDTKEPRQIFYEGSRLRIPQLNTTEVLNKGNESDAAIQNTIISKSVESLKCEYTMNNLDKQATVYKFSGDSKTVKDLILSTSGVLEISPFLCSDKKIRTTISKLSSKLGRLNSIGLAITPDIGLATINVLAGEDIKEKIIENQIDRGLIISFTSAAGVSMESELLHVSSIHLFWTELGGSNAELKQSELTDAEIAVGARNTSTLHKMLLLTEYKDKEGRVFRLGSERFYLKPDKCTMVGSYLSDSGDLRLTHRIVTDSVFAQSKGAVNSFNEYTRAVGQGTFMKPKTTLGKLKDAKKIVTPEDIFKRLELLCRRKAAIVGTVLIHDKHSKKCHVFDYFVGGKNVEIEDVELHEFAEFPFTIEKESIIGQPDRFDIFFF